MRATIKAKGSNAISGYGEGETLVDAARDFFGRQSDRPEIQNVRSVLGRAFTITEQSPTTVVVATAAHEWEVEPEVVTVLQSAPAEQAQEHRL